MKLLFLADLGVSVAAHAYVTRSNQLAELFSDLGVNCQVEMVNTARAVRELVVAQRPDMVFSTLYQVLDDQQNFISTQQILEELDAPTIGSSSATLDLVMRKSALKAVWVRAGVRTPGFLPMQGLCKNPERSLLFQLDRYPYLVKPDSEGNSRGIGQTDVVSNYSNLQTLVDIKLSQYPNLLIEEFLGDQPGIREFTVVMLGNGSSAVYLPGEIQMLIPQRHRLISTADKDDHHTQIIPVEAELAPALVRFARTAFSAAGITDYGRLDVLLTGEEFYALEINGQPMLPDRWFDDCARIGGLSRAQYCAFLLSQSIQRWSDLGMTIKSIPIQFQAAALVGT